MSGLTVLIKYNNYEKEYVRIWEDIKYGNLIGDFMRKIDLKNLSKMIDKEGSLVLDVGAGTSWASIFLAKNKNAHSVALDASKEMLEFAKSKAKSLNVDLEVIIGDAHMLPIRDESFEYVISFRTLLHLKNENKAISEMCRISNNIILHFPTKVSISGILMIIGKIPIFQNIILKLKRNPSKFSKLSNLFFGNKTFFLFEINNELINNRYKIVDYEKYFILPVLIHNIINKYYTIKIEKIFKKNKIISIFGSQIIIKAKKIIKNKNNGNTKAQNELKKKRINRVQRRN